MKSKSRPKTIFVKVKYPAWCWCLKLESWLKDERRRLTEMKEQAKPMSSVLRLSVLWVSKRFCATCFYATRRFNIGALELCNGECCSSGWRIIIARGPVWIFSEAMILWIGYTFVRIKVLFSHRSRRMRNIRKYIIQMSWLKFTSARKKVWRRSLGWWFYHKKSTINSLASTFVSFFLDF